MRPEIAAKLAQLPAAPGVYLMKDAAGAVFYVGKAKSLRDRVRSYFSGSDTRAFVALLDQLLADLEVLLTHNEKEALLLEDDLIKRYRPRFNVKLVDDKRFLCLRLDLAQSAPRLEIVRRFADDGARYFGPYHSAHAIRETLKLINRHFRLRTCSDRVLATRRRPCLQHQLGRCPAPCVLPQTDGEYAANVTAVVDFLDGRTVELRAALAARMQAAAEALAFERAAQLRDQLRAVDRSLERQRLVTADFANRDVVGLYRQGGEVALHLMRTRGGRLVDARRFAFSDNDLPTAELLADFGARYYQAPELIPDEILFPPMMEWQAALADVLSEKAGRPVRVLVPRRGDKRRLVELAEQNARQAFRDQQREQGAARTALERLQRGLHLRRPPERLECFDISHLGGREIVAAAVRFEQGVPRKQLYRRYRVRSLAGQDDFAALYEVLSRRARRGLEEGDLPELIVIDGGKGQLAAAHAALSDHGVDDVELVGLAKARRQDGGDEAPRSPERVFVLGQKNPVVLRQDSAELFLLTRARDEAHRFAVSYQRRRRSAAVGSRLEQLPGVGPARRRALLAAFGSLAGVKAASEAQLARVVGPRLAAELRRRLAPAD